MPFCSSLPPQGPFTPFQLAILYFSFLDLFDFGLTGSMKPRTRGAKLLTRCRYVVVSENSSNLCCQITFRCGNEICCASFSPLERYFRWVRCGECFGIHGERFLPWKDTISWHRTMRRGPGYELEVLVYFGDISS